MEQHLELQRNLSNQLPSAASTTIRTALAGSQSLHLPERSKSKEKHLSYSDLHHHIMESVEHISNKQNKKAAEEEELVKHMSNLPCYLEKGRAQQEKFLNVGVLDWSRLEKWQYSSHHRRLSVSSNNSCSSFVSEGSSANSSRGQSCSPSRQRKRHPSLQFHFPSSSPTPASRHSQVLGFSDEGNGNSQDHHSRLMTNTRSAEQATYIRTGKAVSHEPLEINYDQWRKGKDVAAQKMNSASRVSRVNYGTHQVLKEKMKPIDQGYTRRPDKMQERKVNVIDRESGQKSEPVVLLLPKDDANNSHSGIPKCPKSKTILSRRSAEVHHGSSLQKPREIHYTVVSSNVPRSCPLPYESEEQKCWRNTEESVCSLPHSSQSAQHQAEVSKEPSNHFRTVEANVFQRSYSGRQETSSGTNMKTDKVTPEKIRSTSPFRRLSMGMGKISRSLIPKEAAAIPQSTSTSKSAKSSPEDGIAVGQANSRGRSRSSPLRRLLHPLLKPKVPPNCHLTRERDSNSSVDTCFKSLDKQVCSSSPSSHPAGRVSLDATNVRATNVKDFPHEMKKKSTAFQALLRVAVKNGLPLFTFAVDNQPDILAATMKKLSTTAPNDCIYTFFSIQEAKKKNGSWMNHQKVGEGKGKSHDYVHNVVAQLRVSGSRFCGVTGSNSEEQQSFAAKEFVLFAVDLLPQSEQQQTFDFQPNDELAAVVVNVPRAVINKKATRHQSQPESGSNLQEEGSRFAYSQDAQYQHPIVESESLISMTAILPSGVHSIPTTKGGPSSLLQRWRSGGSCDCGGWDLGCNLRVLANNKNQLNQKPGPSQPCSTATDKFDLLPQGEVNSQPVFSLAPFKDGIHTVEFHSSLTILQAFALCIAVVDGKKLIEVEEPCNSLEEKTTLDAILAQNDGAKMGGPGIGGEVPARYVSYPPVSPVGRV